MVLFVNRPFLIKRIFSNIFKMPSKVPMEKIKENTEVAKKTLDELKNELAQVTATYNKVLAEQLREENAKLTLAVEEAKKKLIELEMKNGIAQIPIRNQLESSSEIQNFIKPKVAATVHTAESENTISKSKTKDKETKKEKTPKKPKEVEEALPIDIGSLDLRVAQIEDIERHPDADTLYVLRVNCGELKPRIVCSGLVKHVAIEDLRRRIVMLLCNLKPVKMRGILSEAMVMCASSEKGVEVLQPPPGSVPGERVCCEGYKPHADPVMNPKKKIFETVAPDLHTNDQLQACYKNTPLMVPAKGPIVAKTLKNVPVK